MKKIKKEIEKKSMRVNKKEDEEETTKGKNETSKQLTAINGRVKERRIERKETTLPAVIISWRSQVRRGEDMVNLRHKLS